MDDGDISSLHSNVKMDISAISNMGAPQFKQVSKGRETGLKIKQEKRGLLTIREPVSKRCKTEQDEQEEKNTLSHHADLCTSQTVEYDDSYMCPLDSDETTDSENDETGDYLQIPARSDIHSDLASSCLGKHEPFFTANCFPSFQNVNSNVNPTFASPLDAEGKTEIPRNAAYKCQFEEKEIESNVWKLRANRVQQILSSVDKEYCTFHRSKKMGIEFNVGFGPKQNFSVASLHHSILLEIAKFALAINSSQQDFIMDILECNFDLDLWSKDQRKTFVCEAMSKVRRLKNDEDAHKCSRELAGPGSSVNMVNQSMGSVNPDVSSLSRRECYVGPMCSTASHTGTKEHRVDLYPFCKDIGLKVHVISSQENKKLDIHKLTNGAMIEVTNFAEKLCGTFDQICLDILRHNFDLDQPNGDSDLAKTILALIPVLQDHKNLSKITDSKKLKDTVTNFSTLIIDCQNYTNLDTFITGTPKAPVIHQNVGSSIITEQERGLKLWPWKLRANQIQQILSVPHLGHCPLYTYSRCKRLGIDFSVGSGVKQNLDPKLLTNGIMVEISTFAAALESAQKEFITEILEYNFHLTFNSEICRGVFAQQVLERVQKCHTNNNKHRFLSKPFKFPDSRIISESTYPKYKFCPKCYEDRRQTHAMAGTVSAEANCSAQKPIKEPSSAFQATEEMIMNSYPLCKKTGLSLFVDKDKPKNKLDMSVLTVAVMKEVSNFTKTLCGKKSKLINDVLEHNFNIGIQSHDIDPALLFLRLVAKRYHGPTWFNDIFVIQPYPQRDQRNVSKQKELGVPQKNEWKKAVTKRQLTLQSKKDEQRSGDFPPTCRGIGLNLGLQNPTSANIHSDSQSTCLGTHEPFLPTADCPPSIQVVNSNVNSSLGSQSNEKGLCGDKEKTEIPRNVLYKSDMKEEELEMDSNMWKLRVNRIKQILSFQEKEYCAFAWSKKAGLEFNVGFGRKRNFSIESLTTSVPLEIAKFALAMNSSQEDFIMEILEYNFDFGQWSEHQRKSFSSELMNRVRWLKNSDSEVKYSKEVFELPCLVSSVNMASQTIGSVKPEVSNTSKTTECDASALCSPDSHIRTKEHRVHLYPFCKDIGLKLNIISSQPNEKIEFSKLTNGAMTEVTNFVEKLCGTFDQICLDILRHNFDLDWQNGDSDLARTILAQIPVILEQRSLSNVASFKKIKPKNLRKFSKIVTYCQSNANLDACHTGSSHAPIKEQKAVSSTDTKQDNDHDLLMWRLRENQIQQILTVPHGENCLFYSYSRCKKLGIDFNVGSGTKQNLDPKLLTNGIVLEMNTFATALLSSYKEFITEILEYNFCLNFSNEHYRDVFTQQVAERLHASNYKLSKHRCLRMPFQLPDTRCIEENIYPKIKYCPKCSQDRNSASTDVVSEANCSAQKSTKDLSSAFQATEELMMDTYRLCKEVGLSLLVDKDKPKDKLNPHVLTRGIMKEVTAFAKRLCGTKNKLINDIIEHNFNIGMQNRYISQILSKMLPLNGDGPTWFNEVFDFQPWPQREHSDVRKVKTVSATQENERKETTKKRKLALQAKKEEATMLKNNTEAVKSKRIAQSSDDCYPICTEIGLDLDVTSKSGDKEKLDLKLLTRAAVMEIYKFLCKKARHYFPGTLYDILDYNFDLSSQHHRCWEFSISAAAKVKTMAKHYRKNVHRANEVFELPFVFEHKESKAVVQEEQHKRRRPKSTVEKSVITTNEVHSANQHLRYHPGVISAHLFDIRMNKVHCHSENITSQVGPATIMQMTGSPVGGRCDDPLWADIKIKKEEVDSDYGTTKPETVSVEIGKPVDSLGYNLLTICPKSESHTETGIEHTQSYNVADPQISAGYVILAESSLKTESITEGVMSENHIKTETEIHNAQYYDLVEPRVSAEYAILAESSVKTEVSTEAVKYEIPVEAAGSQGYSIITICQDTENTLIKEEKVHVKQEQES